MAPTLSESHVRPEVGNFPDLRDGLNESQRRLLKALMQKQGSGRQRAVRTDAVLKSALGGPVPSLEAALIAEDHVGEDEPYLTAYLELARMAQTFRMRYPLVDWAGSFGTAGGDPPADCMFTRCALSRFGTATISGLAPNLLVNGAGGGARDSVYFLSHHLGEVLAAASALVHDPTLSDETLALLIPGPDLPMGGVLPSTSAACQIYLTGGGVLPVRAKVEVDRVGPHTSVVLNEMPGWINASRLQAELSEGIRVGTLRSISRVVDQTDERGAPRLLLPVASGVAPKAALAELFAHTSLETRLRIDMRVLDNGTVRRVSLPALLRSYVHQLASSLTAKGEPTVSSERMLIELEALRVAHSDARRTDLGEA